MGSRPRCLLVIFGSCSEGIRSRFRRVPTTPSRPAMPNVGHKPRCFPSRAVRLVPALLGLVLLSTACWGSSPPEPPSPEEAITVEVTNRSGEAAAVAYSFARTVPTHLGGVARMGQATFSFSWEPGPLQFAVEIPTGLLTSNSLSTTAGDTVSLAITDRQIELTKKGGGT